MVADRVVGRALHHIGILEFVGGHRNLWVIRADPPLAAEKTGYPQAFGNMLEIVPVVELVLGNTREIYHRNQNAVRHHPFPPAPLCRGIIHSRTSSGSKTPHMPRRRTTSALGHFRPIPVDGVMSAIPPKATKIATLIDVGFVPKAIKTYCSK